MTLHYEPEHVHATYRGNRVRVVWNPHQKTWAVFGLANDYPIFTTKRLELHTVGVYTELKPKFNPEGSPGFIGTIASYEILDEGVEVRRHPNSSRLFFVKNGEFLPFDNCRRIKLNGSAVIADPNPAKKEEHEKIG